MKWFNLLKVQSLTSTTSIKDVPDIPSDEPCNEQLKRYADKIKSMPNFMGDAVESEEFKPFKKYFGELTDEAIPTSSNNYQIELLPRFRKGEFYTIRAWKHYYYSPIPEDVACEVLRKLKEYVINVGSGGWAGKEYSYKGYTMNFSSASDIDFSHLEVTVAKEYTWNDKIHLAVGREENMNVEALLNVPEIDNIFNTLGYYKYYPWLDWRD